MYVSSTQQNPTFGAKLISQWRCLSSQDGKYKNVSVVALEKRDLSFVNEFIKKLPKMSNVQDSIKREILSSALRTIKSVLESKYVDLKKIKMLLGVYNTKPCGVLVANIPKLTEGECIGYSSRHNCTKNEGELDWLVTWSPEVGNDIKGVGKALVGEFFKGLRKDGIRDVYVKSELPENSYAQYFYESLGFETMGEKRAKLEKRTSKPYLVNTFCDSEDMIIPMIATRKNSTQKATELAEAMCRNEFIKKSLDAKSLISI